MRVIAGKAKGRKLRLVPGTGTRPITDRVKENLFNLIQWDVGDSRFLDLFAGTGAVGIEALSRGAAEVVFLDTSRQAIATIHANLAHCRLDEQATVRRVDAFQYLAADAPEPFDIIYIAPPQYKELWSKALTLLDEHMNWLAEGGVAIAQIHPKEFQPPALSSLVLVDQRTYGSTTLCFYERDAAD